MTQIFFVMIMVQAAAYLWFQSRGGVVSHRNYMVAYGLMMVGQFAQAAESYSKDAFASLSISSFFFVITAVGIINRYRMARKDRNLPEFIK